MGFLSTMRTRLGNRRNTSGGSSIPVTTRTGTDEAFALIHSRTRKPGISGKFRSRTTRATSPRRNSWIATAPPGTNVTCAPKDSREAPNAWRTAGSSSTTRIRFGVTTPINLPPAFQAPRPCGDQPYPRRTCSTATRRHTVFSDFRESTKVVSLGFMVVRTQVIRPA